MIGCELMKAKLIKGLVTFYLTHAPQEKSSRLAAQRSIPLSFPTFLGRSKGPQFSSKVVKASL